MAKKMDKNTQIAIAVGVVAIVGVVIGVGVNQGWFKSSRTSNEEQPINVSTTPTVSTSKAQKINDYVTVGKNTVDAGIGIYGSLKGLFGAKESASNTSVSADGSCRINDYGMIEKTNN